jgi:hypothetical protein
MPDLEAICRAFAVEGRFVCAEPIPAGHINDTFCSGFARDGTTFRTINQRINHNVFREPEKLMENIDRVTRYAREKILSAGGDPARRTLNLIPTREGSTFHKTPSGDYWRMFQYIDGAQTYDKADSLEVVFSASRAFGVFQRMLSDLPGGRLHETIPNFHHTRKRFGRFTASVDADVLNRAAPARPEIEFILGREKEMGVVVDGLAAGRIPERITHNDTKLNNVMIDDRTGEGICVIDLDTVMPGSVLYDFGDSVRLGAATAVEDECDLGRVGFDIQLFDRLTAGYLDAARDFLVPAETSLLAFSARLLTLECGMRFLADHLDGDVYFKIHREGQNLDRSRTQLKMVAEMERRADAMEAVVRKYLE